MSDLFSLNDAQRVRLQPLLATDVRGVPRVDDRRVINGIIHVLRSGCRWADAPPTYGPRKTLYGRFLRWTMRSIWRRVFEALAATGGPPVEVLLDSTHVKAHRCSAGGKRERKTRRSAALEVVAPPSSTPERQPRPTAPVPAHGRAGGGLPSRRDAARRTAVTVVGHGRPSLRYRRDPSSDRRSERCSKHPLEDQAPIEELLQPCALSCPQRRQADVLQAGRLPADRHPLRQARR